MFDNYLLLARGQNAEQCGMNGTCATQFVVEADGSTYPCDFYCTDDWYLGNICAGDFDGFFHSEKMVEFLKNSFQLPPACKTCRWFTLCRGGGCKRNRVGTDYCRAYQTFFGKYGAFVCSTALRCFMKKTISVLLALVLTVGLFSACSKDSKEETTTAAPAAYTLAYTYDSHYAQTDPSAVPGI